MNPFDNAKLDATRVRELGAALAAEIARGTTAQAKQSTDWPLTTMPVNYGATTAPVSLTDSDIRRIAAAVCDEQERRAAHPLMVTAADVRRWMR